MSLISTWSTIANDNGTLGSTPFYWPEGQAPSTVNDCARLMMATIRSQWNDAQWFNWGYTVANVSGNSFTLNTASWNTVTIANVFQTGGRIKLYDTVPNTLYGTITTVSVSAISVQVTFTPDTSSLTATVTSVFNSIITADQKSIPSAAVPADVVRQSGAQIYGVDAGATDAYAISLTPTLTSYAAGESFNFFANSENSGPATLNVDGLGPVAIVNPDGSALNSAQIPAGSINHVVFDGTNFQLANSGASGGGGSSSVGRMLAIHYLTGGTGATFTKNVLANTLQVECIGGGGGGGGTSGTVANAGCGGGGGAGAYVRSLITAPAASYTYTVGAGGAGGVAGAVGSAGTATTFSDGFFVTLSAGGGDAGGAGGGSTTDYIVGSGSGGGASGGDLNITGNSGTEGMLVNGFANGGEGGASYLGGSPHGATVVSTTSNGTSAGANSGAGGSGGAGAGNGVTSAQCDGGAGGSGLIIVTEYS